MGVSAACYLSIEDKLEVQYFCLLGTNEIHMGCLIKARIGEVIHIIQAKNLLIEKKVGLF